jgi:hypothetical protein
MTETITIRSLRTFTVFDGVQICVFNKDDVGPLRTDLAMRRIESGYAVLHDAAASPLDHDGDGAPGGSIAAEGDDLAAARKRYTEIIGKRPFAGWNAPEIARRIILFQNEQAASAIAEGDDADDDQAPI